MSGYTQLTQEERHQIHILKRARHAQSEMAEVLGRHKASISRGLQRNTGLSGYRPKQAHRQAPACRRVPDLRLQLHRCHHR
ncbi:MAG: helix-turn-helix domain-containing protein [Gammaproteobacteria bacterium]